MRKLAAAAMLAALLVAGCGPHLRPGGPAGGASPSPSPWPQARVLVNPQGTIRLQVGDEVQIRLTAGSGFSEWGPIYASPPDVVAPRYPAVPGGTDLIAINPGRAELTAAATPICRPPTPIPAGAAGWACPAIARAWMLEVVVAPHPRGAASVSAGLEAPESAFRLQVGDRITVPPQLTLVRVTPAGVLRPLGRNPDGTQTLLAVGVGTATITAMSDPACLHTTPRCEIAQVLMQLTVTVSAAS